MGARRALRLAGLTGSAALLAAAGGATWYYAGRVTEPPHRRPVMPLDRDRVEVHDLGDGHLHLIGSDAARAGWWGLRWDEGYARVGPAVSVDGPGAVRPVELRAGAVPDAGAAALFDPWATPTDPGLLGLPVEEVVVDGPIGPLPAWWFPADRTQDRALTAVLVHGRSGTRAETLRHVTPMVRRGVSVLVTAYRNDTEGPPSPDGRSHLGATEWEDVEAAGRWALANGARRLVLAGLSMGGACVAEVLRRSELHDRVAGVLLEAPVLDWGPVLRSAAVQRGLPAATLPLLLPPTMALAGARARIDWRSLGSFADLAEVPLLLIHGDRDATVPVELADALAEALPDLVTYLRVDGAGHLTAWNVARAEVEAAVATFLDALAA
ncbi:alpha/beta hydrolase family protein [Egicoccus sp. AB-alg2]|uniref:alpha/beta hydrolase family protein n=1 Tax=Egicoccus sp. AB-alg2 TaxID=3242693 RepID=UPI00359EFBD3